MDTRRLKSLNQRVRKNGIPAKVYIDNGKPLIKYETNKEDIKKAMRSIRVKNN